MLGVKLICVGRLKERYLQEAMEEYGKRLRSLCRFAVVEIPEQRLPEDPSVKEIDAALLREAAVIEKQIPQGAVCVALCIEGKPLSSEDLADRLRNWANSGRSRLCLVIGGSFGLHARVKARADLQISMSRMTFPHHLARVMAAEQLYRGFSILEGSRYHK